MSNIVNDQIIKTTTDDELYGVVDNFTKDQEWLQIAVSNSYGNIIKDSENDAVGFSIAASFTKDELEKADTALPDNKRIYLENNKIYFITKINNDIIVRTSLIYTVNIEFILLDVFIMLLMLICVVMLSVFSSRKAATVVIDTFNSIGANLKSVNDQTFKPIDTHNKYEEVESILKDINAISYNTYVSMLKIKNEHDKINFVINHIEQGILIVNENGEVLLSNDYLKALFSDEKIEEQENYQLFIHDKNLVDALSKSIKKKEISTFDYTDAKTNLIYCYTINYLKAKWFDVNQEIGIFIILIKNVDEERRNDEIKAEFTSNVSHELKTPITSIRGFTELVLSQDKGMNEKTSNYLNIILNESIRMKNMIDELLYLSNLEYKRNLDDKKEEVSFRDVIQEICQIYLEEAKKAEVTIEEDVDDSLIFEDRQFIYHIISNLVENAIKYNKKGGSVFIKVNHDDDKIYLVVQDSGIGIEKNKLDKIFQRFYRVDSSHNRINGGTGIGLNIVKQICNIIGAKIEVKSVLDEGTTFTIEFKRSVKNEI